MAITGQVVVSCTRSMRRVYFRAYNSRNYFKIDDVMKLLSSINLEETDFPGEEYFRNEAFEVEEVIGDRTALLYFDVEVAAYIHSEDTGSFIESEVIHVGYQDGYFKDDGDFVVVTNDRVRAFENKLEKLIKEEL